MKLTHERGPKTAFEESGKDQQQTLEQTLENSCSVQCLKLNMIIKRHWVEIAQKQLNNYKSYTKYSRSLL